MNSYKQTAIENPTSFIEWIVEKYYFMFIQEEGKSKIVLHFNSSATAMPNNTKN